MKKTFFYKQYDDFFYHCRLDEITYDKLLGIDEIIKFINYLKYNEKDDNLIYWQEAILSKKFLIYIKSQNYDENYQLLENELKGRTKEFILYNFLDISRRSEKFGDLVEDFLNSPFSTNLKMEVQKEFGDYIKSNELFLTPKYDRTKSSLLYNLKSKTFITWDSLIITKNIKYIDFWATWCSGCRTLLPSSKKIQNIFEKKEFNVIYISLDKNQTAWEKISRKENLPEEYSYIMLDVDNNYITKLYNISSIPRYFMISKNGKILNQNAPYPFNEDLILIINKLLSAK